MSERARVTARELEKWDKAMTPLAGYEGAADFLLLAIAEIRRKDALLREILDVAGPQSAYCTKRISELAQDALTPTGEEKP